MSNDEQAGGNSGKSKFLQNLFLIIALVSLLGNFYLYSQLQPQKAAVAPNDSNAPTDSQTPTPTIQGFNITSADHILGNINATVTLVEFSDFQCPYCAKHVATIEQLVKDYPDKVRVVFKQFPLPSHQFAQKAAEASECAAEQGKFWEYHDKAFANQADLSLDNLKKLAADLGLDTAKFNSCLDSGKYTQKVQADEQEGVAKGVTGTPATFVNGLLITGALPIDTFKQIIDKL